MFKISGYVALAQLSENNGNYVMADFFDTALISSCRFAADNLPIVFDNDDNLPATSSIRDLALQEVTNHEAYSALPPPVQEEVYEYVHALPGSEAKDFKELLAEAQEATKEIVESYVQQQNSETSSDFKSEGNSYSQEDEKTRSNGGGNYSKNTNPKGSPRTESIKSENGFKPILYGIVLALIIMYLTAVFTPKESFGVNVPMLENEYIK
jgi:predicted RNase H-like HicB family nuclease